MHHLTQQAHVAQQSRREKLRIPGIVHPDSSHLDSNSDHSVGFASQAQESQGVLQANQSDQEEPLSGLLRGYSKPSHQISTNDMLPVYNPQMIPSDSYNFGAVGELLAVPAKPNAYYSASPSEMGSQTPVTANAFFPGQSFGSGSYFSQRNWFNKGGNWEVLNSPAAQDNLNLMNVGGTHGIPVHTNSGASQNVLAATLLLGALQTGRPDGSSKDGSLAQCSLLGSHVSPETMQVYLMNNGSDANVGVPTAGNMVWLSPPNAASVQPQQNLLEMAFPSTQPSSSRTDRSQGDGSIPCPEVSSPRASHVHNNMRSGDELLFLPLTVDTQRIKHLTDQVTIAKKSDDESYPETESKIRQNFFSTFSGHQQQLQPVLENRLYTENALAGNAYGQCLNLSLSSKRPLSMNDNNFDVRIHSEGENSITSQIDAKSLGHIPIEITSSLSGFPPRNENYLKGIQDIANLGDSRHFHMEHSSHVGPASFTFLSHSKYLKVAQQLLDEVCSVRKETMKYSSPKYQNVQGWKSQKQENMEFCSADVAIQEPCKDHMRNAEAMHKCLEPKLHALSSANFPDGMPALNSEERKDYETRKGKLLIMLQEVDRRYRIYSDQMHALVASFDSILGNGAAIPYTSLALQAMSRYFRCLRDAICGQIQLVCKTLGEEEIGRQLTNRGGISRLRYVDQQLRHQRSFQHMGMLQQHAWRPQRGLPERSVSVLRAWLFEHFLHPYPKDADKVMLARQTGLTRSQVSNWFINARVRLWKPMVEEMYQEEAREQEQETPVKQHVDGENSNSDGITDTGRVEKTCKTENLKDQNYANMAGVDSKIAPEGAADQQVFLEGDGLSSDYYPGNMSSTRNECMKVGAGYKAHYFDDSNLDDLSPVNVKKSRVAVPSNSNLLNPNKEVLVKSDEMHRDMFRGTANANKLPARQDPRLYGIPYNGELVHQDSGTNIMAFEDSSLNRTFPSMYPVNGVSLTLGLRHCENMPLAAAQQSYLHGDHHMAISRSESVATNKESYCNTIFEGSGVQISDPQNIDYTNHKHVGMQMLHDFVA